MLVLKHRGGPLDGKFFILNQSAIGHIDPDPPGALIHMPAYSPAETPIAVQEGVQELANRFGIRRPARE